MLTKLVIKNLRGIQHADIDGFRRVTVLIGPNGSGKSTVLEACLLGMSRSPTDAVGRVVARRSATSNGARWLLWKGEESDQATITVYGDEGLIVERSIAWQRYVTERNVIDDMIKAGCPQPYSLFIIERSQPPGADGNVRSAVAIAANNRWWHVFVETNPVGTHIRLVEPAQGEPLHDLFSRVVQAGRKADALDLVRAVVPGAEGVEVLTEDGEPRLYVTYADRAVPATLIGDGNQALLRITFELASPKQGIVLVEEPEIHQHPRNIFHTAHAILAAARRGTQVILATHSLELVDHLLAGLSDDEKASADFFGVMRMKLTGPTPSVVVMPAEHVIEARTKLEEDIR